MNHQQRLKEIKDRLNEIWFSGTGPCGGEVLEKDRKEFNELLDEEKRLLGVKKH